MKLSDNPSSILSKELITQAMVDLMQNKHFNNITISEISDKAGVVRRTFYRNFDSKEEVLSYKLDNLIQIFKSTLLENKELTIEIAVRNLFRMCYENKEFFFALQKSCLLGWLLDKWSTALPVIHDLVLDRLKNFPDTDNEQTLSYLLTFNVGGVFNIVIKWINEGMKLTPDELADIVTRFAIVYR